MEMLQGAAGCGGRLRGPLRAAALASQRLALLSSLQNQEYYLLEYCLHDHDIFVLSLRCRTAAAEAAPGPLGGACQAASQASDLARRPRPAFLAAFLLAGGVVRPPGLGSKRIYAPDGGRDGEECIDGVEEAEALGRWRLEEWRPVTWSSSWHAQCTGHLWTHRPYGHGLFPRRLGV
jgi:hypothetical protein